jgi:hypothetical protein
MAFASSARRTLLVAVAAIAFTPVVPALAEEFWVTYPAGHGPGHGRKVVLVSGDEEYRSEEALPQLGKILATQHGFDCQVLFAIDPETGHINPNVSTNIPGLQALETADLLILFTRFRQLPDEQMEAVDRYLRSGKPVLGMRTSTHAFNFPAESRWAHYGNGYQGPASAWQDGFGRLVLGEKWISHHGKHKHESTRARIAPEGRTHPVLRGIGDGDIWGPTDVYGVRLPLPGDSVPLLLGEVVLRDGDFQPDDPFYGMRPADRRPAEDGRNAPMMPIAWARSYQLPEGSRGQVFMTTMGSSTDLMNESLRRMLVNASYWLTGLEDQIPETGCTAGLVGEYDPTAYEFRKADATHNYWRDRKMSVSEHAL